ncbi:MAG TPA: di-heme oxidoredictase family protein, partial [Terriglobia bacterium]
MILLHPKTNRSSKSTGIARLIGFLLIPALLPFTLASAGRAQVCGLGGCAAATTVDPGVRGGPPGAGGFISGLNSYQQGIETSMSSFIAEVNVVAGGTSTKRVGLGARFDSNSCTGCHAGPANGGASLPSNPLFNVYTLMGAQNSMPFFETANGPTLVARVPYEPNMVTPDGHVHQLFVITGRTDAGTCNIQQPDFSTLAAEDNLIFRQTTPFFGGGLLEIIQDSAIVNNMMSNLTQKMELGITGHPNYNADDGSITRFGWKAQKRSLMLFAGEAYNIEEGISNEIFPNKTDETPGCTPPFPLGPPNGNGPHGVPDDRSDFAAVTNQPGYLYPGDPERFAIFGRILNQPQPSC